MLHKFIFVKILFFLPFLLEAQFLIFIDENNSYTKKFCLHKKQDVCIENYLKKLQNKGFFWARVDSTAEKKVFLTKGKKFQKAFLYINSQKKIFKNIQQIENFISAYQNYMLENGYPFSSLQLKNIEESSEALTLIYEHLKGREIRYQNIYYPAENQYKKNFLRNYLSIAPNQKFNQKKILELNKKIKLLPNAEIIKNAEIEFTQNGCDIYLYMKSWQTRLIKGELSFDFSAKPVLQGNFQLEISNMFGHNDYFSILWKKKQFQTFEALINLPYIYTTKTNLEINQTIIQLDSSTYSFDSKAKPGIFISSNSRIDGVFAYKQSLSTTNDSLSFFVTQTGIGFKHWSLNSIYLPTSGMIAEIYFLANKNSFNAEFAFQKFFEISKKAIFHTIFEWSYQGNEKYILPQYLRIRSFSKKIEYLQNFILTNEFLFRPTKLSLLGIFTDQAFFWAINKHFNYIASSGIFLKLVREKVIYQIEISALRVENLQKINFSPFLSVEVKSKF